MSDVIPRPPCPALVEPGHVRHYAPDMTVTAAADVTLDALQTALGNQWLPIDGPGEATLAALVAGNSTGPLRLGYGAWRDLLLGVQFRNGLGELITAGGRAVKNVAGYDLVKLMVGQGGCLGELVTITTRTYLRPRGAMLAEFAGDAGSVAALEAGDARPNWALLSEAALSCGYHGDDAAIAFYESALREHAPRSVRRYSLEDDQRRRRESWSLGARALWRVTVPPLRVREFIDAAGRPPGWVADPAFGVVLIPDAGDPRAAATGVGGFAYRVEPGRPPRWSPDDPVQRKILAALKHAFDPHGRLPPITA